MRIINFLEPLHTATRRDHLERITPEKPYCCTIAKQYGKEYWDGDRKFGYGGMVYDGRYEPVAAAMIKNYSLKAGDKILDIGCGKGFLLHEIKRLIPSISIEGADISQYALENSMLGIREYWVGNCTDLPYGKDGFDFVYSINTFHNLAAADLKKAIQEMNRVTKPGGKQYICVESYRNQQEKMNMLSWQLTCESFHYPQDWMFLLQEYGYTGDVGFVFFT